MKRRPLQLGLALSLGVGLGLAGFVLAQQRSHVNDQSSRGLVLPQAVTDEMIDVWCVDAFGDAYRASNLAGGEPLRWRCWGTANGIFTEEEIDMTDLCQQNFGSGYVAVVTANNDGWECTTGP